MDIKYLVNLREKFFAIGHQFTNFFSRQCFLLYAGEAEQGGRRGNYPYNNVLEGHCPLKNHRSCDAVLYLNFVV